MAKKTLTGRLLSAGHRAEHEYGIVTRLVPDVELVPSDPDDEASPKKPMLVEKEVHAYGVVAERMVFHLQLETSKGVELLDDVPRDAMAGADLLVGEQVHVRLDGDVPVAVELA